MKPVSNYLKKRIAVVLALLMLLSIIPLSSSADGSGVCGDNLSWSLSGGTLTITGTGDMYDWKGNEYYGNVSPWYSFSNEINRVVISDGVTRIGNCAFYECGSLSDVSIPSSVLTVGYSSFEGCSSLTSITVPNGVKAIGGGAFLYCEALNAVSLPDSIEYIIELAFYDTGYYNNSSNWENGVLYIGNHLIESNNDLSGDYTVKSGTKSIIGNAFSYCNNLTNILIPDNVTGMVYFTMEGCSSLKSVKIPSCVTKLSLYTNSFDKCDSLAEIIVDDENTSYCDIDGVFFSKDLSQLIKFPAKKAVQNYSVPDGVTEIYGEAFYNCSAITAITLPDGLTSIGEFAFSDCSSLTEIEIPAEIVEMPIGLLYGCTSLQKLTIHGSTRYIDNIFGYGQLPFNLTIYTQQNSAAHKFALSKNIKVEFIPCTHPQSQWFCDTFATVTQEGKKIRKCTVCYEALENGTIPMLNEWINPFSDTVSTQWFYGAVRWANGNGIINGINPSEFAPDSKTTRGMLVTLLGRLEGVANDAYPSQMRFWDTSRTSWYSAHIAWASENGIVNGYPDNTFKPDITITRQEMAAMFANYAKLIDGIDITANLDEAKFNSFSDSDNVANWAKSSMLWAVSVGLINGSRDVYGSLCLNPESTSTRAEVAQLLYNYYVNICSSN